MSTVNLEHKELITCDLCKRRYNIDVYKRHINENQCLKRNQRRLPFESVKQRSIQIGDKIFSIQQQKNTNHDIQIPINREKEKPKLSNSIIPRTTLSNNRRRTLEQAKQLLERRTKYKPPCINQSVSPRTKFKNDNLPIKVSDRSKQPILTHSPKLSKYQLNAIDQTFSHEPINSARQSIRKANTWTRSSKQTFNRDAISPIRIPTFRESSSGLSHESIPINQNNYEDDDDEFELYSPSPPSTPKYQQKKHPTKPIVPTIQQNFIRREKQTFLRPIKDTKSIFYLPPIRTAPHPKTKPIPWR